MQTKPVIYVPHETGARALRELGQVDWASLGHAYSGRSQRFDPDGDDPDVPAILRSLWAEDGETRSCAYVDGILGYVWHQGSLFAVTAHVVPFLAAFAADPAAHARGHLLASLCVIVHHALQPHDGDSEHARAVLSALEQSDAHLERMEQIECERCAAVVTWLRAPVALAQDEFEAMYGDLEAWGDEQNDDA